MAGNVDTVTAGLARMPAPAGAGTAATNVAGVESGNNVASAGQDLPVAAATRAVVDLNSIARRLNDLLAERQRNLTFHVDEASGRTVITVRDVVTQQVVRQIPSEEVLAFARAVEEAGVLVDALI